MKLRTPSSIGTTAIELVIASVIGIFVLAMIGYGIKKMATDTTGLNADISIGSDLYQLVDQMMRFGRDADLCSKVVVTAATATIADPISISLQCDFKVYYDLGAASFRFRMVQHETQIRYEVLQGGIWKLNRAFGGGLYPINSFTVCDSNDISTGPSACAITSAEFSRILNLNTAGTQSRYFQFQIQASKLNSNLSTNKDYTVRSAFYTRNATPVLDISYLWGAK